MPATAATLFTLAKSYRVAIALISCGSKVLRLGAEKMGVVDKADDVQNSLLEVISSLGGNLAASQIDKRLDAMPPQQLKQANQHLVHFTGLVLQALVEGALDESEFASCKAQLKPALDKLPEQWAFFVESGVSEAQPMAHQDFVLAMTRVLEAHDTVEVIEPGLLSAFFAQWLNHCVSDVIVKEGWHVKLAQAIAPGLGSGMAASLVTDHPAAEAAFKKSLLRFHTEEIKLLIKVDLSTSGIAKEQKKQTRTATKRHKDVKSDLGEVKALLKKQSLEDRRAAYLKSLLAAFSAYQELALDNYAAADQTAPDIWDIFVHPACAKEYLRPEDMDKAQLETPPRLPAEKLLPLLGSETERRQVLLADPGMGKSTLVQSLIALIASGRSIIGAPALTGLLPVPLILRDLVPLLPQGEPEGWDWNSLLEVLIKTYRREENASPLFQAWEGHEQEFRDLIHSSDQVFFLVDGLDEIGDLRKRKQIVQAIQEGIRTANVKARWLITSRVIGYDEAPVDLVKETFLAEGRQGLTKIPKSDDIRRAQRRALSMLVDKWNPYLLESTEKNSSEAGMSSEENLANPSLELSTGALGGFGFVSVFDNWRVGVSRPIARRLYLAPFDDQRQNLFTQRWFKHRHSTDYSTVLMREVRQHGHEGVRVIARVPNLLCMMNMLKRSGKPLPDGRAALYEEIVKAYLGGIESTFRNREANGLTCPLSTAELRHLLALLGAHMQQTRTDGAKSEDGNATAEAEGSILISQPEIEKLLLPVIENLLATGEVSTSLAARELLLELLKHIARRSGLLIPRSVDAEGRAVYGFTHLSFLEFFAAEWLGREFDRLQKRYARAAEAQSDGETLSVAELEREFPAPQPISHKREDFPELAANPSWQEPLIFLLESRPGDASTLLRWLFPALHPGKPLMPPKATLPGKVKGKQRKPFMPLSAVRLAVKLSQDRELPLSAETLHRWWRLLWTAQLQWDEAMFGSTGIWDWQVAPVLLERVETQPEVIARLAEVWTEHVSALPDGERPRLRLIYCQTLSSAALQSLAGLVGLEKLSLFGCPGLEDTAALAGLKGLRVLDLSLCLGLKGRGALQGLTGLLGLEKLYLYGCRGLEDTATLAGLKGLRELNLSDCTGLKGRSALQGLAGLVGLEKLDLRHCTGLNDTAALAGLEGLRELHLSGCTGLKGRSALQGLAGLVELENLYLYGCEGLEDTAALAGLKGLRELDLSYCTGLMGRGALQGLAGLVELENLYLYGCEGLKKQEVEALKKKLGPHCQVYWP